MLSAIGVSAPMTLGPAWQLFAYGLVAFAILSALTSLFVLPNHVTSWQAGAEGELETSKLLAALEDRDFEVLHDLRIPGSRANIDHVVVGPTGVWVIETKSVKGSVRVRGRDLFVGGRRKTEYIDEVTREADAVATALDGVPVNRVICVHRGDFPLFTRPSLAGVPIVPPSRLVSLIEGRPPLLTNDDVRRLAKQLRHRLRPAS